MNLDDLSSVSYSTSVPSTRSKIHAECVVIASKLCKYDQLGGRSHACVQGELESEKNEFQGFVEIKENDAFLGLLKRLQSEARCIPSCKGACTCVVARNRPSLTPNDMNVVQGLTMSNYTGTPSMCCILTTCETSTPYVEDKFNAHSILMNNERKRSSSSSKHGFKKKCRDGYSKRYKFL